VSVCRTLEIRPYRRRQFQSTATADSDSQAVTSISAADAAAAAANDDAVVSYQECKVSLFVCMHCMFIKKSLIHCCVFLPECVLLVVIVFGGVPW